MKNKLKKVGILCLALSMVMALLSGCTGGKYKAVPVEESYEYTEKHKNYVYPAAADGWAEKDALKTDIEDGEFYCFTADTSVADDFINTQRTLIYYLRSLGVEVGQLEYYGTDYGFSFSESSESAAYVDLSSLRTWQQVLVTLQTIWGDYTEYGYVYSMANAIASELGWQTDEVPAVEKKAMDAFFAENPEAINLLYPTFTTKFASEEAVNCSKALAIKLFDKIKWHKVIANPIETQLDEYYELVSNYADSISTDFTRQTCGYAYYGENVRLRIMTTYAEMIVDADFEEKNAEFLNWYHFADYESVYNTANTINSEITKAVEYFGLEEKAGVVTMKWLVPESEDAKKLCPTGARYYGSTHNIYTTSIRPYLHEYYHHIEHLLGGESGGVGIWQSQAFCDIGRANSQYEQYFMEYIFTEDESGREVFKMYTGREYCRETDYFESYDIWVHSYNKYLSTYMQVGVGISLAHHLAGIYGEREVYNMLLYPDTVEEVTGKTWDELLEEREQYIRDKYAHVDLSMLPEDW